VTPVRIVRVAWQATFLGLWLWLLWRLAAGDPRAYPWAAPYQLDPLSAAGAMLSARSVTGALAWAGAGLLLLTLVFGRFFCGWVCPLGTLQQFASFALSPRSRRESIEANRWRPAYAFKYYLLAGLLAAAFAGSLQTGLLDPLSILSRGLAAGLWPALPRGRAVPGGWLALGLLAAVLVASRFIPRLFCRAVCPLGALLGVFSRFAVFRIARREGACSDCTRCRFACQGADEPLGAHRPSECMVCLSCVPECPDGALSYAAFRPALPAPEAPDLRRRHLLGGLLAGAVAAPVLRAAGGGRAAARAELLRPPGSLDERSFLERCTKCMLCQQACPTGAIQPALGQAGVEGFWTPVVVPRRGGCELACTRCGEVCPTGAIARLAPARKAGYDGSAAVRIGTAFVDRGRCLPWAMGTPCVVCEEMCPVDPKAIWLERAEDPSRGGGAAALARPRVEPARCTGCGLCQNRCPVGEEAAIRVTSVGESRDPFNRMLLRG
jgi:MauM/NapG family ferredoxin protein